MFEDNIWTADSAEMKSLSSFYHSVKSLLFAIDNLTKHTWVKPLKDKNAETVLHGFIEINSKSSKNETSYRLIKV